MYFSSFFCRFGPRFPPMNKAYSVMLMDIGKRVAEEMGITDLVHRGVYTCLGGPNFETVAELKMLRMVGVDAVGAYHTSRTLSRQFNLAIQDFIYYLLMPSIGDL